MAMVIHLLRNGKHGVSREQLVDELLSGKAKFPASSTTRLLPGRIWIDRLAGRRRGHREPKPPWPRFHGPYARDGAYLQRRELPPQGYEILATLMKGTPEHAPWPRNPSIVGGGLADDVRPDDKGFAQQR